MALKGQACMVEKQNGSLIRVQHIQPEGQDGGEEAGITCAELNRVLTELSEAGSQIIVLPTFTLMVLLSHTLNQPDVCFLLQGPRRVLNS